MKFNILKKKASPVVNYEGAPAVAMSPAMELYSTVATSGLSDTFYETSDERIARIRELVIQNDPVFVARMAVYARRAMHLRSIPLVLAVEMAKVYRGNPLVRKVVREVVLRADEITEILAYYQLANERKGLKKLNGLSKQIQKGLADAFNRFDEYQFGKYNKSASVTLRDALFLVHPKSKNEEQQVIFDKIAKDELRTPYTWETELSALGQMAYESEASKSLAFKAKWEELISSGKLGYMALLRNLRNILEAGVSATAVNQVCTTLSNREAVQASKQLPFRFLAAYTEIQSVPSMHVKVVLDALESAVEISVENLKGFTDQTRIVIACDVSGSMQKPVSSKSKVQLYDIGLILAMLLQSRCKQVVTGMFGDTWKVINLPSKGILANTMEYRKREGEVGYATNGHKVLDDLFNRKVIADKVFVFTDCQLWDSASKGNTMQKSWYAYKSIAPQAKLYLFDMVGYGKLPLATTSDDVFLIAGWSDKVFDVLAAIENGNDALEIIRHLEL